VSRNDLTMYLAWSVAGSWPEERMYAGTTRLCQAKPKDSAIYSQLLGASCRVT
jgi:hypothetical protein